MEKVSSERLSQMPFSWPVLVHVSRPQNHAQPQLQKIPTNTTWRVLIIALNMIYPLWSHFEMSSLVNSCSLELQKNVDNSLSHQTYKYKSKQSRWKINMTNQLGAISWLKMNIDRNCSCFEVLNSQRNLKFFWVRSFFVRECQFSQFNRYVFLINFKLNKIPIFLGIEWLASRSKYCFRKWTVIFSNPSHIHIQLRSHNGMDQNTSPTIIWRNITVL